MCIICSLSQTFDPTRHNSDNPLSGSDTSSLTASEISGATDVEVGNTASGVISTGGEQDVFAITLEAGETYSIAALGTGSSSGTLSDTDLHLYDSEGNFIEYDDFAGAGLDALITFTATSSGTYYIMVDSWSSSSSGSYQLQIEEAVALPPTGSEGTYEELSEFLQNEGQGAGNEIKVSSSTITVNISGLTALGQQMAQWAMEAWEMVANVDFQIVTSGEMVTVDDSASGYSAWAFLGAQNNENGIEMMVSESWFDFGTTLDSYTFQTYVHEFGHILGLNHLGPYNGSADFGVDNYFSNDSYQVSVMSYFSQTENPNVDASFAYLAGPMIADILAIQDFYGAPDENSVTGGDTVYGLNSNLGNYMDTLFDALATGATSNVIEGNRVAFTIYDQGGTDLIDLSFADSSTDVTLNLNEGVFSNYGTHIGAFNIAIGTVIENASTGAGDDTITGNDADNVLRGNGGNDTLNGGGGDDILIGGGQDDVLSGGAGSDAFVFTTQSGTISDYEAGGLDFDGAQLVTGDAVILENTTSYNLITSGGFLMIGDIQLRAASGTGNILVISDGGTTVSSAGGIDAISSREGLNFTIHDADNNESFDRKVVNFAANDEVSQIQTFNDDGSSEVIRHDALSNRTWSEIREYYDSNDMLFDNRITYDTGVQIRTITDVNSAQVWNSILEYRNDSGDLYDKRTNYDNGQQLRVIYDTEEANVWETVLEYRDDAGVFYEKRTNYDNGNQFRVIFDTDESQIWETVYEYRDAEGVLYDKRTNYDEGGQLRVIFDTDSTASWDTILESRNADNELFKKITNYDNGQQQLTLIDVDGEYAWETYIRVFDVNGDLISETFL